ncbi:hypothetical protein Q0590_01030 [Rhodocytophaga aerolata]|uniref:Glycosyltransferase RgtA/B/C/D-like domain-containing protein n=1 Tax=Rhodocytophaga aerolata TaxID=455078 RepID=A0ABT8R0M7_9BACT|nr:hypothetical protein [Rhodocytophaga aerolata]MDO1444808.1 hypothetical protein [Rhodocytophaga aerolata]
MINFFKISQLITVIIAFLLLIVIHLPILTNSVPLIVPELKWMLVGERMGEGFMMYKQIWSDVSPLSGFVYWLLDLFVGRSQLSYQILALMLVILQGLYFNHSLQKHQQYPEKSNLPLLLYVLCMGLFFDFFTLSPMLMSITFLLLALDGLFSHINDEASNDEVFSIGFYIGVATLFYFPLALFAAYAFICFLLLAATNARKYFLMLFGFIFTLGLAALFFYMINGLEDLYYNSILRLLEFHKTYYVSFQDMLLLASPFIAILALSAFQLFGGDTRFIHYQIRCQQALFMWAITAGLCLLVVPSVAPYQLIVFVPVVVFFGTHLLLTIRKKILADLIFMCLLLAVVFINFSTAFSLFSWVDLNKLVVNETQNTKITNKKLLVAGDNLEGYLYNKLATPYLEWSLAERHFNYLEDYVNVVEIYENFRKDMPDVIIDQNGKIAELFTRIPALAQYYAKEQNSNVYIRKGQPSSANRIEN